MKKKLTILLVACVVVILMLCLCLIDDGDVGNGNTTTSSYQEVSAFDDESTVQVVLTTEALEEETVEYTQIEQELQENDETTADEQSEKTEVSTEPAYSSQTTRADEYDYNVEQTTESGAGISVTSPEEGSQTSTTEHIHSFEEHVEVIYHPEEGHYEEYCVSEGYTEERYEVYSYYCYRCGEIMDDWDTFLIMEHSGMHGAYGTGRVLVETIEHPTVYEEAWVVDKEAYYEEVVTNICSQCGYVR